MQTALITIPPGTPFLELQHLFVESQIDGAPVVDDRGAVIGVVSTTDLLRTVDQVCDEDIDAVPGELPERLSALTARDIATPEVVWVEPSTPVSEIARRMRAEGIHRVLVGAHGKLAGILTAFDLLRAVTRA